MARLYRRDVLALAQTREGRAKLDALVKAALAREAGPCQVVVGNLPMRFEEYRILWGGQPEPDVLAVRRAVYKSLVRGVRDGWATRGGRTIGTVYRRSKGT